MLNFINPLTELNHPV